ncbi:MAG: Leucine-rich repeat (LRR) protein [Rhodothermales bacterium]|jgi:Leucine-rich repeat (LRR) protein
MKLPHTLLLCLRLLTTLPVHSTNEFVSAKSLAQLQALPPNTKAIALSYLGPEQERRACLNYLRKFKSLQSLHLWQTNIGSADLSFLAEHSDLQSLFLRGRRGYALNTVDDGGIPSLGNCPNLKHLAVGALGLTDEALKTIGKLEQLQTLAIDGNAITDEGLLHLRELKHLRELDLSGNDKIKGSGIRHLSRATSLQEVILPHTFHPSDAHMRYVSELRQLRKLNMGTAPPGITDTGMVALGKLSGLESLQLELCDEITDAGYAHLVGLVKLKELRLRRITKMTREAVPFIAGLSELRLLKISDAHKLIGADLEPLGRLIKLKDLSLWNVGRGAGDFAFCTKLTELETFITTANITTANITPARLASIAQASQLRSLSLTSKGLLSLSAQHGLTQLTNLEQLYLSTPSVTDETIRLLADLPELRNLDLAGANLTDKALPHFAKMKLTKLQFSSQALSPEVLKTLAQLLPQCVVRSPRGTVAH